jgi:hypothetical protein
MPYIVMELVTGGSFDKLIEGRGGKIDAALALRVGMEAAEGLKHAADGGLVHGDIKPENILLDENGQAKIVDFGIASLSGKSGGQQGEVWGTPYYIAPEKVRRQKADFRSDIYSLGATLFHAIAGIPPFEGKDSAAVVKARLARPAPNLAAVLTSVDPEAAAIVDRMLQADPQLRHPTYDSLLGDMRRYVEKAAPKNTLSKRVVIKGKSSTGDQATGSIQAATGPVVPAPEVPGAPKKKGLVLQRGIRMAAAAAGPRVGVLALNPHAGEGGLFGREEADVIEPAIADARAEGLDMTGPLVPDTAFCWLAEGGPAPHDAYVAMYHDQGLIPFKMAAFHEGVNMTLGLPFVRTSPDHGTAFDLAWQGQANPSSFFAALRLAARLA